MTKRIIILILFALDALSLLAQEWSIRYPSEHPAGYNHFHDGLVDENGTVFLAGQEGVNKNSTDAVLFRILPDGSHFVYKHNVDGFHSNATCLVEMPNNSLLAAGNLSNDTCDRLLVLIFDKNLNLLEERQYDNETGLGSFGKCKGILDHHGNVIIATYLIQRNEYNGVFNRGAFYKFDHFGDTVCHRYLFEDEPNPVAYLLDFKMRQMWCKEHDGNLLCLVPGFGGIMSFITFDSAFNYIEEYPIWRDDTERSDHTLYRDCYSDHWFQENEALFFSSVGDADHNRLRISQVNTHGEILEFRPLNERTDTIDDAALTRCMAAPNDSIYYFSFHSHQRGYYPGNACVYRLNQQMEITGYHIDDDHESYRTCLILPTSDGGCITVNDSCIYHPYTTTSLPFIKKLRHDDFAHIPWTVTQASPIPPFGKAYPNPCQEILHIPMDNECPHHKYRCRIENLHGQILMDCAIQPNGNLLNLDTSKLKQGIYLYQIYTEHTTLRSEKFLKE